MGGGAIAKIIPIVRGLNELTKASTGCEVGLKLQQQMDRRFPDPEGNTIWAAGTLLDPRFKHHDFVTKEAVAATKQQLLSEVQPGPTTTPEPTTGDDLMPPTPKKAKVLKIWESHDARVEKVQKSADTPTINKPNLEMANYEKDTVLERDQDPLKWWKNDGSLMPELQKLAKKYLCIPATSTPSERLFSKAGELISQRRSNLSDKNVNTVLFLIKMKPQICIVCFSDKKYF